MHKTDFSYLPSEAAAMLDVNERDHEARNAFQRPKFARLEDAAAFVLSARRYLPMGDAHLTAAAATLEAAGIFSPGEVADRPELPPIRLEVKEVFSANGLPRTSFRIMVEGQEVGTAIERMDGPELPWRLTMFGHCGNVGHRSKAALVATVSRILNATGFVS